MNALELRREIDRFVLHFETPRREISAYALASALVGLADAVREANAVINPGYRVEVVVEALTEGSFRATVRTVFAKAKDIFAHQAVQSLIMGILATYIYEKVLKTEDPPNIIVSEEMVIIEIGGEKIIVPKDVYEAKKQVEKSERFQGAVGRVFEAANVDPSVSGLAIVEEGQKIPPLIVPREKFGLFQSRSEGTDNLREIVETTQVEISRAILERGRRRWEFFWRGFRISAPILDDRFFDHFFAHQIMIAPGDALEVVLRIVQERNEDSGIFVNVRYEIVEVLRHIPRLKQGNL